jgi:hypothetical protein
MESRTAVQQQVSGAQTGNDQPGGEPVCAESKQDVLLLSLRKFYEHPEHLRVLTDVLHSAEAPQGRAISLRILDWLVTNYAKKHNVVLPVQTAQGARHAFNMFLEYKSQLKAYSKRFFDPFCRRERIDFLDADGRVFHTTVGQLNFFRWALSHGVVEYGTQHNREIEDDMLRSIKHRGVVVAIAGKAKRRALSEAAIKGCTKTHLKVTVTFP